MNANTSAFAYLGCPPGVRIDLSYPLAAQRVTVFGFTCKRAATSARLSCGSQGV